MVYCNGQILQLLGVREAQLFERLFGLKKDEEREIESLLIEPLRKGS
jgi:hypothetical protein